MSSRNIEFNAINCDLISIQSEIRKFFNWDLQEDIDSAVNLLHLVENLPPENWTRINRNRTLLDIIKKLNNNKNKIVIVGAAITTDNIIQMLKSDNLFVAADGAAGVFSALPDELIDMAWSRLVCVVSDADGGIGTENAFKKGIPIILHAHGDNQHSWRNFLTLDINNIQNTKIVLTHQIPQKIEGMYNIGGFTDGDRAACFVRSTGISNEKIIMTGSRTDIVGKWSGKTNKELKLLKLQWMSKIFKLLNMKYSK
ncbi:MAG: hypothetical protein ACKVI6_00465 [Candidatus Poseidoniales archaeon]|jgi:uncharacterized Rossmann fold enzyme